MLQEVNPPPQIVLPEELKSLGLPVIDFFEQLNRYNLQMFNRVGGGVDLVDQATTEFRVNLVSSIFDIREQIGSGVPLTIDTTGFTIDTTQQTTDMDEM